MDRCVLYTLLRVEAALRQLDATLDQQFPYRDAEQVVLRIKEIWTENRDLLLRTSAQLIEVSAAQCFRVLGDLRYYLPILGYVARSASVRHTFEPYGPLKLMASKLLCPDGGNPDDFSIGLVLSSTWDYTPQTTRQLKDLPDFVFIIVPGCEATNPLLLPLAGHELGHAVWERDNVRKRFWDEYANRVTDFLFQSRADFPTVDADIGDERDPKEIRKILEETTKNESYANACRLVSSQLEELFCDFVGLYLFGSAFLYAFTYFLSPDFPAERSPKYPTVHSRLKQLSMAHEMFSEKWGGDCFPPLPNVEGDFWPRPSDHQNISIKQNDQHRKLLQSGVDQIALDLAPQLVGEILRLGERPGWTDIRAANTKSRCDEICTTDYRWLVPAENSLGIGNIVNAGWEVATNSDFWETHPFLGRTEEEKRLETRDPESAVLAREKRRQALHELLLKNIEVLEYEHIISRPLPHDQA